MTKKYRVTLPLAERDELEGLLARGKADVRKIKHAQILLKADEAESGPAWPDARIAEAFAAGITGRSAIPGRMGNLLLATRESDSLRSENPGMSQPSRGLV